MINRQKILLKFIQIHINVDWECISNNYALSENFMREFQDKINWNIISAYYHKLSENFIREFKDKLGWDYISMNQKLSENFIREFQNDVYWNYISEYQNLSKNFKEEFKYKLND